MYVIIEQSKIITFKIFITQHKHVVLLHLNGTCYIKKLKMVMQEESKQCYLGGVDHFKESLPPRKGNCTDLYPLIRPPRSQLALGRMRILNLSLIRSPPTLAVCYVAQHLPLGGADVVSPFTKDETRRHFSYLSFAFRQQC